MSYFVLFNPRVISLYRSCDGTKLVVMINCCIFHIGENFAYHDRHVIISIMHIWRIVKPKKEENFDIKIDPLIRLVNCAFHSCFSGITLRITFRARTCTIAWYIPAGIMKKANSLISFATFANLTFLRFLRSHLINDRFFNWFVIIWEKKLYR